LGTKKFWPILTRMQTTSLILIAILGFIALLLVTHNEERMPSGLGSLTRLKAGGVAGPRPWASALINERNRADGSPCRVPFDWIPTPGGEQPPCDISGAPPYKPRKHGPPLQEKMST
jgi:hypothetical protein